MNSCATCRWWNREQNESFAECRRFPPQARNDPNIDPSYPENFAFPVTLAEHWCGEWRAKDG
jgi:hypothetical protein